MEDEKNLTTEAGEHLSMFYQFFWSSKGVHFILVLVCIFLFVATCEPCATTNHLVSEKLDLVYDPCGSYGEGSDTCVRDPLRGDISAKQVGRNSETFSGLEDMYVSSELFCFPSSLPDFSVEIPRQDTVNTCSRHKVASFVGDELQNENSKSANTIKGLGSAIWSSSQIKASEIAEADELVLRNWRSQGTTSGVSILDDEEVLFPMVHVGSHLSKWITVKNPSAEPVIMQLILNSREIIDQCRAAEKLPLSSSLVQNESSRPAKYGFSTATTAITEAYVHPEGRAILGPIVFYPSERCAWRGSAVIRNNLSGIEWLPLRGFGGSLSLVLLEDFEVIHSLEFNLSMPNPFNLSSPDKLYQNVDKYSACYQPLSKDLFAKNTGDLPLEIRSIEVSGADCGLDGFKVHTCDAFSLEPGESRKLMISFRPDFSAVVVHRDLELALANGIFVIPMKANIPVYMLSLCRNSIFWILLKKLSQVIFVTASLMFLFFFCVLHQVMALDSSDCLFKTENASISRVRGPYRIHRNHVNSRFSISSYMDNVLKSVGENETSKLGFVSRYSDYSTSVQEQRLTTKHMKNLHDFQDPQVFSMCGRQTEAIPLTCSLEANSRAFVETKGQLESQQTGNLTVRTGKERGRRRKKKRSANGVGLLEVSSSQSGNSTPSSPLSPLTAFTPKRTTSQSPEVDHAIEDINLFADVTDKKNKKEKFRVVAKDSRAMESKFPSNYKRSSSLIHAQPDPVISRKSNSKPALLPSATFPSIRSRVPGVVNVSSEMTFTSAISPCARAPGPNLCKETSVKIKEKPTQSDEFTYDIWGNHFSGFHLVGNQNVSSIISNTSSSGDSQSFFARGPQILMQKSQARSVSPVHKLPQSSVTCVL